MSDSYADVQQSFNRCLQRRDFLRRFYTIFTQRDSRIAERFRNTDWDQQVHLLRHGISASIMYASGTGLGQHELERLRQSHGPGQYDIPDWMYDDWLEALIQALAESDSHWDAHLEQRWREAMGRAIDHIAQRSAPKRRGWRFFS